MFFLSLGLMFLVSGCYVIKYIIQPEIVEPNSSFNVKIVLVPDNDPSEYQSGSGIFGVLLPDGWIVKDSIPFKVFVKPGTYYNINQTGVLCCNNNITTFLKSKASVPPSGYQWWGSISNKEINLNNFDSIAIDFTIFTANTLGQYDLRYVFGDNSGWNSNEDYFLEKEKSVKISVELIQAAGIKWKNENWELYPNPSNGQINIRLNNMTEDVQMKVYDLNGKLQRSEIIYKNLSRIDLSSLAKGTYILSLEKEGEVKTKKFIIQ